jgi:translocation and assembly module TamA
LTGLTRGFRNLGHFSAIRLHLTTARHAAKGCLSLPMALLLVAYVSGSAALELEVKVEGVSGPLEKNVLALLKIYQERDRDSLLVSRIKRLHEEAPEEIRKALEPFGYYRVDVTSDLKKTTLDGATVWQASYQVDPGPVLKIARVDYRIVGEGEGDDAFPAEFGVRPGDPLEHAAYEKAKAALVEISAAQGYLDAVMKKSEVRVDLDAYEAEITVLLDTGARYYFGPVRFEQDILDPKFLQRYVRFKPGDPYDYERVLALQGNLLDAEYFKLVEISPLVGQAENHRVPLNVRTVANKPNKFRFGLGFATDTGPRVSFDYTRRRIGTKGHRLVTGISLSPVISQLGLEYRIPLARPASDSLSFKPAVAYYNTATRVGQVYSFEVAHSVALKKWRRVVGLEYQYEDYDVAEDSGSGPELVPSVSWSRMVTDDPLDTRHGYRAKFMLRGAADGVVSRVSYLQGVSSAKLIRSLDQNYRFLTRAEVGATATGTVLDLPGSKRFFAGGDNSVRGYRFDSLGPEDEEGNVVGGRYLFVGSLEFDRRVKSKWSVAAFYDFGNAFDPDFKNVVAHSVGVGARWRSPIGPVRVDLSYPFTDTGDRQFINIVVGPDL